MAVRLAIRSATPDDVEALLDLYTHLTPDGARCDPERARNNLAAVANYDGSTVFLGEVNGNIVVTCTLIIIPNLTRAGAPYALIENVVTHAAHRGRGYGKAILDAASDQAWEHDCYKIMLSTGSAERAILMFYEAAGFEQSRIGFQKRRVAARTD